MYRGEPCNRKLFIGSPGFDIKGEPKIIKIKCPRCRTINLVSSEIKEEIIVKIE